MTRMEFSFALVAAGIFQCLLFLTGLCLGFAGLQSVVRPAFYVLTLVFPFVVRIVSKRIGLRFLMLVALLLLLFNELVWIPRFTNIPLQ